MKGPVEAMSERLEKIGKGGDYIWKFLYVRSRVLMVWESGVYNDEILVY